MDEREGRSRKGDWVEGGREGQSSDWVGTWLGWWAGAWVRWWVGRWVNGLVGGWGAEVRAIQAGGTCAGGW